MPPTVSITAADNTTRRARSDLRFRRASRLPDTAAFGHVFRKGRRSRDKLFTVLYSKNDGGEARLGLAISKKHSRLAVARNRLKRVVRESFRRHREALAGLDIVVLNQPGADGAGNQALYASLERHWETCSRYREPGAAKS